MADIRLKGMNLLPIRRFVLILPAALAAWAGAPAVAADQATGISKPRPAPSTPPEILPLPPAVFDPTLAIGGEDLKARKVDTRLTVEVQVNGRGPYHFLVDSGADTSVVGLRIARDLQLPLGTPAILNAMTARNVVDRVKVAELTLGPSTVRNLQLPALRESDLGGDGHDRDRRAGRAAADDGFRKAPHQGRGRAHPGAGSCPARSWSPRSASAAS